MNDVLTVAADNLLSPMVLFFALGFVAAWVRSDLSVPEAIAKGLALYLVLAIGFKGGAAVAAQGFGGETAILILSGVALSFLISLVAFAILRLFVKLPAIDAGAIAAHYGSVSVVTFVAATEVLNRAGLAFDGAMVTVMAVMETPAIVCGLLLARGFAGRADNERDDNGRNDSARRGAGGLADPRLARKLSREVFLNGNVVLLVGSFAIGWLGGAKGLATVAPFLIDPFKGVLCLFLLDMGLVAAQRLRGRAALGPRLVAFGVVMPLIGGGLGLAVGAALGASLGNLALLAVLAGSASYIVVPAAMRLALPEANPGLSLALSLGMTFPFNLILGIPLWIALARFIA